MPNLLVVDDEKRILITLREILEEDNHQVFVGSSYDEALVILENYKIEVAIIDIILQGKSGLDLLEYLKSNFNNIQVIIITGNPNLNSAIQAIRSGASDYLAKPIKIDELKDSVQRVYKNHLLLRLKDKLDIENKQIRRKLESLLKEKTHSLEKIEERYKSVAMTSSDAIIIMDQDLNIIETNKSAERLFEFSESELSILRISDLIPSITLDSISQFLDSKIEENFITDILGRKKDLSHFPIEISISQWKSESVIFYSAIIHNISERRNTEEQARKLSRAVEQSANAIVITDIKGNIEYVNPSFEKLTGYSFDEVIGKNPRILKSGNTTKEEYETLWETILSGNEWSGVFYNLHKDGHKYWESISISPVKDDMGNITNFIAIKEDITEKKEAARIQSALLNISNILQEEYDYKIIMSKMHAQLSVLLNTKNFFITLYNKETNSLYFPYYEDENDEFEYLPAAGTLSYYTIQSGTSQLITLKDYNQLIKNKKVLPIGTPAKIWAGSPIIINNEVIGLVVAQDYEDENKIGENELQLLKFVTNQIGYVIERNQTQEALAYEKEELSVTISSLAEAVITTDLNGKITLVNQAVEKIFNVKQSMMLNELIFKFFWNSPDGGLEKIKSFYQRIKLGVVHYKEEQFSISFSQRKRKIIKVSTSPLQLPTGSIKGVVFVIRDITQQLEIENQLSLSQKMESIGQLAAGIAHEINTPMQYIGDNTTFLKDSFTEIIGFINELKTTTNSSEDGENLHIKIKEMIEDLDLDFLSEEIPESLNQSQLGIEKVRTLVLAMKDFAHPGQKDKTLSDINKGIEVTSVISKNEWKYVADLKLSLEPNLPLVPVILDEINQVILNMIVNSSHSIEEKSKKDSSVQGEINISTKSSQKYIEIIIKDNGLGIPKEKISRIFDPFYTTKDVGKGTGQGLAIAHNIIVVKHSGKISVSSVEGKGTTFIIQLPLEDKN